jgi:hypothetical protein
MKLTLRLIPALMFVVAVLPVYSQVGAAATVGGIPVVVGGGMSDFLLDWGPGQRMEGITAWADLYPRDLPRKLDGLGIEVEGRDTNFGRPAGISRMRQDTGLGGAIYAWNRYRNFRPYGKFLFGIGSIDFPPATGSTYSHDAFLVLAPGGGAEYRVWKHVWVRGDYEYQIWRHTFGPTDLTPQGFTVGASYDFRPVRSE